MVKKKEITDRPISMMERLLMCMSYAKFKRRSFAASNPILLVYLSRPSYNKIDFDSDVAPTVLN